MAVEQPRQDEIKFLYPNNEDYKFDIKIVDASGAVKTLDPKIENGNSVRMDFLKLLGVFGIPFLLFGAIVGFWSGRTFGR